MPLDDRKRWKEALEINQREARRTHPDAEDTTPPPPDDSSWPPKPVPGAGSPSATIDPLPHVERSTRWLKAIAGLIAAVVALWFAVKPGVEWFASRPSADDLRDARTYCAGVAASAAANAVAPYQPRMEGAEAKIKRDGQRWDALDKWHRQQFQRRNSPAVPQFGPKAESRGNAATVEDLDTP
jgi:hypothetical protein